MENEQQDKTDEKKAGEEDRNWHEEEPEDGDGEAEEHGNLEVSLGES